MSVVGPNLIAVGVAEDLAASGSDVLGEFEGFGFCAGGRAGFVEEPACNCVALGDDVILGTAHGAPGFQQVHIGGEIFWAGFGGQHHGLFSQVASVLEGFHVFLLHGVFLFDLLGDLLEVFDHRLKIWRCLGFRVEEFHSIGGEGSIFIDPVDMASDKEDHVVDSLLYFAFLCDFLAFFEEGLDYFGASAGAGAARAVWAAAMMGAQFTALDVKDRSGLVAAKSGFENINGREDGRRRVLAFEEVDN